MLFENYTNIIATLLLGTVYFRASARLTLVAKYFKEKVDYTTTII